MDARATTGACGRALRSPSAQATRELGRCVASLLGPGSVLALHGELAVGKTTFVSGLAQGLGSPDPVNSPTFTLMHEYRGCLPLYHLDAWMDWRGEAFLADGGDQWFSADGVCAIEWAERVERFLPRPYLALALAHVGPDAPSERRVWLWVERPSEPALGAAPADQRLERLLQGLRLPADVEELAWQGPPRDIFPPGAGAGR